MRFSNQRGVGLLEVLIALLILAIAILGFAVMQLRAVEATAEGFNRVQAMSLARDLAEKIRLNREAMSSYVNAVNATTATATKAKCYTANCTAQEKAESDVVETKLRVQDAGMRIAMSTCPGVSNSRHCIFIAWNKTEAANDSGDNSCTVTDGGKMSYNEGSKCIVMEAY